MAGPGSAPPCVCQLTVARTKESPTCHASVSEYPSVSTQLWAGLAVIRTAAKNQVLDAEAQCCLQSQFLALSIKRCYVQQLAVVRTPSFLCSEQHNFWLLSTSVITFMFAWQQHTCSNIAVYSFSIVETLLLYGSLRHTRS